MTKKIIFNQVSFMSQIDESLFFNWLDTIECITSVEGSGLDLVAEVDAEISSDDLRELIALFFRYDVSNKQQLSKFLSPVIEESFYGNKDAYWHMDVFG